MTKVLIDRLQAAIEYGYNQTNGGNSAEMFKFYFKAYLSTAHDMAMEPNTFADELIRVKRDNIILAKRLEYLFNHIVETKNGMFHFTDGTSYPCQKAGGR